MKSKKVTLQINKPLAGKLAGDTVTLETDRDGTIIDRYWRRRLAESKNDKCVEILTGSKK